jgi:hypothetical protein
VHIHSTAQAWGSSSNSSSSNSSNSSNSSIEKHCQFTDQITNYSYKLTVLQSLQTKAGMATSPESTELNVPCAKAAFEQQSSCYCPV